MKREQATREYFGISKSDSLVAAVDAYEWVEQHPEEAPFVLRAALFDLHTASVQQNRELVSKAFEAFVQERTQAVRSVIKKAAISKAANGGDIHDLVVLDEAIELLSKSNSERGNNPDWDANLHPRGKGGQFRTKSTKVKTNRAIPTLREKDETALKIPHSELSGKDKAQFQQAYMQVGEILRGSNMPDSTLVYGVFTDNDGEEANTPIMSVGEARSAHADVANSKNGLVPEDAFRGKNSNIQSVKFVVPETGGMGANTPADLGYDLLGANGSQILSNINNQAFANYSSKAGAKVTEPGTGERFYNQVEAGSKLATDVLGPALGPKANTALYAANFAATHAAEAEKVIGPKARKSAYRYRGVEKTPNAILQNTINEARNQERKKSSFQGEGQNKADTRARERVIYGSTGGKEPIDPRNPQLGMKTVPGKESPLIQYFRNKLPNEELYVLNRDSGNIPPSQGVIIDRKGNVVTEAMGYGDDWYLPFNLKNLSKLQGGEYVRTRAYGGLTAEDIYTGLVSGARAVTVVSHSGVYTVEFDDEFRGSRRYNDKAARMVGRYEHLLDSLASNEVRTASRSQARDQELQQNAANIADPVEENDEYKVALKRERERDDLDPQLAEADKNKIRQDVADQAAVDAGYANAGEFAEEKGLNSTSEVVNSLGATAKAEKAVERAEAEYKMAHKPLRLNANGYKKAQEALENQFPYYFGRVSFRPWSDGGAWNDDDGYVKPRYNRPAAAKAGYHDETITGEGKRGADRTGFQNKAVRERVAEKKAKEKEEAENSDIPLSSRKSKAGLSVEEQKQQAYLAMGTSLLNQYATGRFSSDDPDSPGVRPAVSSYNAGAAGTMVLEGVAVKDVIDAPEAAGSNFKATFPLFKDIADVNDLESALRDPERREKVMAAIDAADGMKIFSIKQEARDNLRAAKSGKLGVPRQVKRGSTDRRQQLDDFFNAGNSSAAWQFGSGFDNKEPSQQAAELDGLVLSVQEATGIANPEAAIDSAIKTASSDWQKAKAQQDLPRKYSPSDSVKTNIGGKTVEVIGSGGTPNPEFFKLTEDLFKAKQAHSTMRKDRELQAQASGNSGPEIINNFAEIKVSSEESLQDVANNIKGEFFRHGDQRSSAGVLDSKAAPQDGDLEREVMRHYMTKPENEDFRNSIDFYNMSDQEISDAIKIDYQQKKNKKNL